MGARRSIQTKLFLLVSALTLAITLAFTFGSWRWYEVAATSALEQKARTYAQLVGRSVESAIAFDDHETAREAFNAVTVDADIRAIALFRADGTMLEGRGDVVGISPRTLAAMPTIERSPTDISCQALVASREGPRGSVVVVLSKSSLARHLGVLKVASSLVALAIMAGGFAVAWWLSRNLARRIGRIAAEASAVASGELTRDPVIDTSSDEVGQLAGAFNTMVGQLRRLVGEIETNAADEQLRLEKLVAARTEEVAARNEAMRLLLDNVAEGFLMVDSAGLVGAERSRAVDEWFGPPEPQITFWKYIASVDPDFAAWFEMSWDALCDESLPMNVAVEQFPTKLETGNRHFEVAITPILENGALARMLIDIRDVTHRLERERGERLQREVLGLLERALDDRSAYLGFVLEAGSLVTAIAGERLETSADTARAVHTLKGNCGLFGLTSLATFCHDVETRMLETGGKPSKVDRAELAKRWQSATGALTGIFSKDAGMHPVKRCELDGLVDAIASGEPRSDLLQRAMLLRLESVDARLNRLVTQGASLAARLGKQVEVSVDGGGLRFDPMAWAPFWSALAHVVSNAIDHGIETPERRALTGKPATGSIAIRAHLEDEQLVIELADDGSGIDWSRVVERARLAGLPTATRKDLEAALVVDGFSTKMEVGEVSGRGIGLGAVRACCAALGGTMSIGSQLGSGTTVRFGFSRAALGDAYAESFADARAVA